MAPLLSILARLERRVASERFSFGLPGEIRAPEKEAKVHALLSINTCVSQSHLKDVFIQSSSHAGAIGRRDTRKEDLSLEPPIFLPWCRTSP